MGEANEVKKLGTLTFLMMKPNTSITFFLFAKSPSSCFSATATVTAIRCHATISNISFFMPKLTNRAKLKKINSFHCLNEEKGTVGAGTFTSFFIFFIYFLIIKKKTK